MTDNILPEEVSHVCVFDMSISLSLYPLGEIVGSYEDKSFMCWRGQQWAYHV